MTGTMPTQIATEAQALRNTITNLTSQLDGIGTQLETANKTLSRTNQADINTFKSIYSESISVRQNLFTQVGELDEVKNNKQLQGELFTGAKLFSSFDKVIAEWNLTNTFDTASRIEFLETAIENWATDADKYFSTLGINIK
jgi:hypothetical protein